MHYETAADAHTPEEIVARCAERFACLADDCILFKWSTGPHLPIAMKVLELQGFKYVTSLVWNKERAGEARGPGYWFTGEHEIVLVGVRGKVVPPAVAHFRSTPSSTKATVIRPEDSEEATHPLAEIANSRSASSLPKRRPSVAIAAATAAASETSQASASV